MGIRFESNYQRFTGVALNLTNPEDPLLRWVRIHEWQVDTGFIGKLLMVLLSAEPQFPVPTTADYGWIRVKALTVPTASVWTTAWEGKIQSAALTARQTTPRLVILPLGSGITFTAGQGLMTQALATVASSYRWWSCYVIDAGSAT